MFLEGIFNIDKMMSSKLLASYFYAKSCINLDFTISINFLLKIHLLSAYEKKIRL